MQISESILIRINSGVNFTIPADMIIDYRYIVQLDKFSFKMHEDYEPCDIGKRFFSDSWFTLSGEVCYNLQDVARKVGYYHFTNSPLGFVGYIYKGGL